MEHAKKLLDQRMVRYVISGALSFAVENATFMLLYYGFHVRPNLSNIGSVCVALIVNFFVSKHFVFKNKKDGKDYARQGGMYFVLVMINMAISTFLVTSLIHAGIPGYITKPVVTALVVSWTYVIYKKIIFVETATKQ